MATYEILVRLKGPAGEVLAPATPPSFEAASMKEALTRIADGFEVPDNETIIAVGVSVRRTTDLDAKPIGFKKKE
jgi:hypothetical protein